MDRARVGWLFVAVQVVLLAALVLLPRGDDWPVPGWLRGIAWGLTVLGLVVVVVAGLGLGRALTPTPVPNGRGGLRTDGLYRFVRHPIYTGVLGIVLGIAIGTGRWAGAALAAVTVAFFVVKARWEEARLVEAFPDYVAYAAATPRFVPFVPSRFVRPPPDGRGEQTDRPDP
jgi:protein-S-isoprenylcysteine O-methyltransferase Ste14